MPFTCRWQLEIKLGIFLGLHFGLHLVLTKHPDLAIRILGIVDDFKLLVLGRIRNIISIYFYLQHVLKDLFGVNLNLKKSSLLCLQMHTIQVLDPASSLEPIYQQFPQMHFIPVATQGTITVGVPVGATNFVNAALSQFLTD